MKPLAHAAVAALTLALLAHPARAHDVQIESTQQPAVVIRLNYADGEPFAFEAYELYRPGQDAPTQVGRTNAAGQVVFLPGAQTQWRLKAYTADGHGVDRLLTVGAAEGEAAAPASAAPPRTVLLASGLGLVFGLFGLVQLFLRKSRP